MRSGKPRIGWLAVFLAAVLLVSCRDDRSGGGAASPEPADRSPAPAADGAAMSEKIVRSDDEWRTCLNPEQYRILRQKRTEQAFTGEYYKHHEPGVYTCAGCGNVLFASDTKYDSGTGWPSFWAPATGGSVVNETDRSLGMDRTEVLCRRCDAHLGHVFEDGPRDRTGLRYCINSAALGFRAAGPQDTGPGE